MIKINDLSVNDFLKLDENEQAYYLSIYEYLCPIEVYNNVYIDIMSDNFTFNDSLILKRLVNCNTIYEQIDIFESLYKTEKGFVIQNSMCNFTRSLKFLIKQIEAINKIEESTLTSQVEKKYSGYGEDRLSKFEWINIADTIAIRYNITPFDVLKWGWYDTMIIMRYIDTVNYVSNNFNDLILKK